VAVFRKLAFLVIVSRKAGGGGELRSPVRGNKIAGTHQRP
jgi:hypothetical protein